jgi:hypothetical protein
MADPNAQALADAEAWSKQDDAQQAALKADASAPKPEEGAHPYQAVNNWFSSLPQKLDMPTLDKIIPAAESALGKAKKIGQDVVAGAAQGVTNVADSAYKFGREAAVNFTDNPVDRVITGAPAPVASSESPIWTHAKSSVQDFIDAVKVKDPGIADNLVQYTAQVVPSYLLAGRLLGGLHGIAHVVATGAAADATALDPHAPRFADVLGQLKQTDTKIGAALKAAGPYGLNAYINYLGSNANETEAQGRFKNALDGILPNFIGTHLLHAAGITVKQGYAGLRYAIDNGVGSSSELASLAKQRGAVGDLNANGRPPLRQSAADPADALYEQQVREDMDRAAANPDGKRPPLRQGEDAAAPLFDDQVRHDMLAAEPPGQLAYHGTPYDFDMNSGFDNAKIGTGEGAQTYGYGHYLAEEQQTAAHYQNTLTAGGRTPSALRLARQSVIDAGDDKGKAFVNLMNKADSASHPNDKAHYQAAAQFIKSGNFDRGSGSMVTAEIPSKHFESMIDNDKPMSAQPKVLEKIGDDDRDKLEQLLDDHGQNPDLRSLSGNEFRQLIERAHDEGVLTGGDPADGHGPRLTAQYLDSKGIAGVKYADAMSRNPVLADATGKKIAAPSRVISLLQEADATHSGRSGDALTIAINRAKARGWDNPKAFYQDREALEKLEELKDKGAKFAMAGTRNFVVFDGKKIKVTGKEK